MKKLVRLLVICMAFIGCGGGGSSPNSSHGTTGLTDISQPLSQLINNQTDFDFTEVQGGGGKITVNCWWNADNTVTATLKASKPIDAMGSTIWTSQGRADFEPASPSDTWTEEAENSGAATVIAREKRIDASFARYNKTTGSFFSNGSRYQIGRFTLSGISSNSKIAFVFGKK